MTHQSGTAARRTSGANARKPYVRIVTDKRREQNRRAQKAYRERLKKKLEVLEEQAASVLPRAHESDDQLPAIATTDINIDYDDDDEDVDFEETTDDSNTRIISPTDNTPKSSPSRPNPRVINLADAFVAAGDLPFTQGSLPAFQYPEAPTPDPVPSEVCEHNYDDYGDMWLGPIWGVSAKSGSTHKQYPSPPGSKQGSKSLMTLTPRRTPSGISSPRSTVANPYMNHMHLVGEGNIEASLAIASVLRISRSQYINDHPSHFPGCYVALNNPDPRSPTNSISSKTVSYRISDTFMNITPELYDHLESVKPPMRPTPAQLLNPHPTYLDCIVFPHFREHAVKASVDGVLDHAQFFTDLMHGGLVCWGGMSGLSNKHGRSGRSGKRDMRDNVAWSTRSWEAQKWFLKKWTWLIGTEEEEEARGDVDGIWKGSRWWWAMRGEDDSEDEDEDQGFAGDRVREVETGGHCL